MSNQQRLLHNVDNHKNEVTCPFFSKKINNNNSGLAYSKALTMEMNSAVRIVNPSKLKYSLFREKGLSDIFFTTYSQ